MGVGANLIINRLQPALLGMSELRTEASPAVHPGRAKAEAVAHYLAANATCRLRFKGQADIPVLLTDLTGFSIVHTEGIVGGSARAQRCTHHYQCRRAAWP